MSRDEKLSEIGRRDALAVKAKTLTRALLDVSRVARTGRRHITDKRAALSDMKPAIDRTDAVSELRRQEMRAYLRNLPEPERVAAASQMMEDAEGSDAVLDASPMLSGLKPDLFKMLKAERLKQVHGRDLAELDGVDEDLANVEAAVAIARQDLLRASGLREAEFDGFVGPIAAEIDRR